MCSAEASAKSLRRAGLRPAPDCWGMSGMGWERDCRPFGGGRRKRTFVTLGPCGFSLSLLGRKGRLSAIYSEM